uniref:Uncharacterized protein n=1 Tax=Pararge aegeria TaxID=116150 RepID=S4NXG4_9NEOP
MAKYLRYKKTSVNYANKYSNVVAWLNKQTLSIRNVFIFNGQILSKYCPRVTFLTEINSTIYFSQKQKLYFRRQCIYFLLVIDDFRRLTPTAICNTFILRSEALLAVQVYKCVLGI